MKKVILLIFVFATTIGSFAQNLVVHCNDKGKYGYVDENGKEVVKCQYDLTENIENGIGKILKGNKYGFVNSAGKVVVQPKYTSATFSGEKFWLMDEKNNLVIQDVEGHEITKISKVVDFKTTQGNQKQFWLTNAGKKQQIYDLQEKKISSIYDEIRIVTQEPSSEIYAVQVNGDWTLLSGDFKNPLPLQASAKNAESILSLYQFWQLLASPEFKYEEFIANENAVVAFQSIVEMVSKYGVTADLKKTLPSFVWSINSIK